MSDNIDIKIREDGSRTVSRNLNDIADAADKTEKSVKGANKALTDTAKATSGLDRLKQALYQTNISLQQAFDSSRVERFDKALVQYRNGLMKHFEMISKGAKASASAIKSQMEALTATPVGLEAMSEFYRSQEKAQAEMIQAVARDMAAQEAIEKASFDRRLKEALGLFNKKQANDVSYTAFWASELDKRDKQDSAFIANSVKKLSTLESAEAASNSKRLQSAISAINARKSAEEAYTAWWATEIKKRDTADAASKLRTATQRSGMQTVNSERLDRSLVKGVNPESALYKESERGGLGQKTALQNAELQAMQRQVAMMQLLLPMAERQNMLDVQGAAAAQAHSTAKASLTDHNTRLASATRVAGDNQTYWNNQSREAHALARGLSGSLGQLWLTYGSILPLLTGAALGSAFVGAAKSGSDLAYQLTFVKALGGETEEAIGKLKEQAHDLGTKGAFGPRELASGYRVLSQAGKDATESLALMPDVLNLATVGELKMDAAGLAIVGTLNAFRLGVDQSSNVSDMFAKSAAVSQSSVEDLTQAMRYASTTSTLYKQNLEDTMTALTLLARVNITGTSAGTAYRNMLKEIYTPTEKAKKAWVELGVKMTEVVDGKEKVRSFVDIMYDLQKIIQDPSKGYTAKGQMNIIGDLFGERGSKEAAEMLTIVKGRWMELRDEIANSKGFGANVAGKLNETVKISWAATMNTLDSELIRAFDKMENGFGAFSTKLKEMFQSEDFKATLNSLVQGVVTLGNALLSAAPYLLDFAKAWLVLKAAQLGVSIASLMISAATAAQGLAAGMLAASGAMGPVARSATMLSPLLAALGGPLTIILGLLAAGAAAWVLWGKSSETAAQKATKSAETKLAELRNQAKYGTGDLGKERQELDALKKNLAIAEKLKNISSVRSNSLKDVEGLKKAVSVQSQLVDEMEKAQKLALTPPKIIIPTVPIDQPTGPKDWPGAKESKGGSGPSGRLGKDENALAKLKAQLLASEQEYGVIAEMGEAQFKLNEGKQKALEIQEKIVALEKMSSLDLKENGITNRKNQLDSLKEQQSVAEKLNKQLQQNEILKVNTKIDEEVRLTKLLPLAREEENKYLAFRNELLGKGAILDATGVTAIREKVAAQIELNKVTAARDQFLANSDAQKGKDFSIQTKGLTDAQKSPNWTKNDTDKSAMGMLSNMGIETSGMQAMRDVELAQISKYYEQIQVLREIDKTNASAYEQALGQLSIKRQEIQLQDMKGFFGSLAGLQSSSNKKLGAIGKAAAITQATMYGVVAVQKAYTGGVYPWNIAMAAAQGALAATNVAKIAGLNFATGGSFVVGGSGGVDSQQVSMRASPGERVTVSTPTQVRKGDELNNKNQRQGSGTSEGDRIKIVNVVDPNMLQDYLSTPAGERVLVNTIQRNAGAIRNVMNG